MLMMLQTPSFLDASKSLRSDRQFATCSHLPESCSPFSAIQEPQCKVAMLQCEHPGLALDLEGSWYPGEGGTHERTKLLPSLRSGLRSVLSCNSKVLFRTGDFEPMEVHYVETFIVPSLGGVLCDSVPKTR